MDRIKHQGEKQMNITKENAIEKCCEVIIMSWTYNRLTSKEAQTWDEFLEAVWDTIKGPAKQRYDQTMNLYRAFLRGCGYDGPYWREPANNDTPTF
jgi:hypothetical protein